MTFVTILPLASRRGKRPIGRLVCRAAISRRLRRSRPSRVNVGSPACRVVMRWPRSSFETRRAPSTSFFAPGVGSYPGSKSSGQWSEPSWWQHIVLDDSLNIVATGWGKRERDSFAMAQKVLASKGIKPRAMKPGTAEEAGSAPRQSVDELPPCSGTPPLDAARAILRFLPSFEARDFSPGVQRGGVGDGSGVIELPWVDYSLEVSRFIQALYDHGWVIPFDWASWQDEARRILEGDGVEGADAETLRRLLTVIARTDHFSEGFMKSAFDRGWIHRILYRLEALTASAGSE